MLERKEDPYEAIRYGGNFLKYLHAHGTKRVAPGAFYLDDVREATDQVNWRLLGLMLDRRKYNGPIVPEPFGAEIRDQLPVLGEGLPPAIEPGRYYDLARTTLSHEGLI
jgi:sugar phosphate isomerase/epimerase